MDTNNGGLNQGTEANMDITDWRSGVQGARPSIIEKIMDTLKRHLLVSGQDGLHELRKIAQRFEEKIFTAATSQSDYLRKISLKMLTMETKSQGTIPPNQGGPSNNKPPEPGLVIPPQVHNQGQQHPISMSNQTRQSLKMLTMETKAPLKVHEGGVCKKKKCYFCKQSDHFKKDCPKRKKRFEKKEIPFDPNHKRN